MQTLTWSDTLNLFADAMPGFEERPEQNRLAETIETAFGTNQRLLAQAGCGTGKSFAGLGPAINWSLATGQPVVVATATKALQDQYMRDLPFLAELYAQAGKIVRYAVVKGRSNYACRQKLDESPKIENLAALVEELEAEDATGDLDRLSLPLSPADKGAITSSADECPGKAECAFGEICFAEAAKERAKTANIIVVSHALLLADTLVRLRHPERKGMIPDAGAVIVDEGHELEEYATSALGGELSLGGLEKLGKDVASFVQEPNPTSFAVSVRALFKALDAHLTVEDRGRKFRKSSVAISVADVATTFGDLLVDLSDDLDGLAGQVDTTDTFGDDKAKIKAKRLVRRIEAMQGRISGIVTATSEELVRWAEDDARRGAVLNYAPLQVGEFLAQRVWRTADVVNDKGQVIEKARPRPVVIMSATLTTGGDDFSYLAGRLGLDDYEGFDAGTPFDFPKQARLFIPRQMPFPESRTKAEWRGQVHSYLEALVTAAGGRALLLFTSRAEMDAAYAQLGRKFAMAGLTVLVQGQGSNAAITEEFKADETSVLFALKSFMTGFDVKGDALRLVVIDKMPFASPDDVIASARAAVMNRKVAKRDRVPESKAAFRPGGSFYGMSVPAAILPLLQGLGRLIRDKADEGLMVILDSRVADKGGKAYAGVVNKSLPPAQRVYDLPAATAYLAELAARRD